MSITSTTRTLIAAVSMVAVGVTGCGELFSDEGRCVGKCDGTEATRAPTIVNGQSDLGHSSVGTLNDECTATLIGARTVLTASHCITIATTTFRVGGATYAGTTLKHPQYSDGTLANDIALVLLSETPTVAPSPILDSAPFIGQRVAIVGFGVTGEDAQDFGSKRVASNSISTVTGAQITFIGASGAVGNHCYGDSGGPAFVTHNGVEAVAGVTSYGNGPCGIDGVDTRVDAYKDWIVSAANGDVRLASQGAVAPAPTPPPPPTPAPQPAEPAGPQPTEPGIDPSPAVADDVGTPCQVAADCRTGICAAHPAGKGGFCTQRCGEGNGCAGGAVCYPSADPILSVCGPPVGGGATSNPSTTGGEGLNITGVGCAVGAGDPSASARGLLLMLLVLVMARASRPSRRRVRRP